jgi:hypothetical protein
MREPPSGGTVRTPRSKKRIWFDIETEQFTDEFRHADSAGRLLCAPAMRIACTFDGKQWRDFLPGDAPKLIALLRSAEEIISFNGLEFDEIILRAHHKLTGPLPSKGRHVDLKHEIHKRTGKHINLNDLAKLNLGQGKHTQGRSMTSLDLPALTEACRSDVLQTYVLWQLWRDGKLAIPEQRTREPADDGLDPGPGHHMVNVCSECGSRATLVEVEADTSEMSEGEEADYMAGVWGYAFCRACGFQVTWGS